MSAQPRLSKFHDDHIAQASAIAGFATPPAYSTTHLRFAELEADRFVEAIRDAADELVRKARDVFPHIGENVWVDGTAFHSRARLHRLEEGAATTNRRGRGPKIEPASDSFLKDQHQAETEAPESDKPPSEEVSISPPPDSTFPNVVVAGGVAYGCLDPTAGIRLYRTPGDPRGRLGDSVIVRPR